MGINRNCLMLIIMLIFVFCNSTIIYAETNTRDTDIKYNENITIDLDHGLKVNVENANNSSYKVIKDGETLYEEHVYQGLIEKVHIEENYLLVESRLFGSGSYVSFDLFYLNNSGLIDIYHSTDFTNGNVSFENNEISVTYPKYIDGDSIVSPSFMEEQTFKISNEQINSINKKTDEINSKSLIQSKNSNKHKNPSSAEINRMITEAAIATGIPPEILKAIAWQESTWRQYDSNGNPITNSVNDGGIGIMQITLPSSYLSEHPEVERRLKYDIEYNIRKGAEILLEKWNLAQNPQAETALPSINDGSKDKIENWYFAIMAYNGRSEVNDPNLDLEIRKEKYGHTITKFGPETYQETIYRHIKNQGLLPVTLVNKNELNFYYKPNSNIIYFGNKLSYIIPTHTSTKHLFREDEVFSVEKSVNLRKYPDGEVKRKLVKGEPILLTGNKVYPSSEYNHYVYYPVKTSNGETGYVASSYIDSKSSFLDFSEISPNNRGFDHVSMLASKGIISGFNDGTFRPKDTLTRVQAALMFVRALNLPTPNVTHTGFDDVSVGDTFYREIAAAKDAGIFRGVDNKFNKSDKLTRSEMAAVLVRSFKLKENSDKKFTDVPKGHQFEPAIQTLYASDITKGISDTEYGFHKEISRVDFSILLNRTLKESN